MAREKVKRKASGMDGIFYLFIKDIVCVGVYYH
jgi:hypothetical protein